MVIIMVGYNDTFEVLSKQLDIKDHFSLYIHNIISEAMWNYMRGLLVQKNKENPLVTKLPNF